MHGQPPILQIEEVGDQQQYRGVSLMALLSVSDTARRLGVAPKMISDLFYARVLDDDLCPVLGGRRVIPEEYVPTICEILTERGKLPGAASCEN